MKIIGNTSDGHIVEMSRDEVARAAGFPSMYSVPDKLAHGYGHEKKFPVGTTLEFIEATTRLRRLAEQEEKVRQNAALLRGLADMIEQISPTKIVSPELDQAPAE